MRILVATTPGAGHVHPVVPLARELAAAGHDIVWAVAPGARGSIERLGFRTAPAGPELAERNARFAERSPEILALPPRRRRLLAMTVMFAELSAPRMHDDLVQVFDAEQPDLVVREFAELASAAIAANRGIPDVTVGFSGALSDELAAALSTAVTPIWARHGLDVPPTALNGRLLLHPFPAAIDPPRADGPAAPMRPLAYDGGGDSEPPAWIAAFGRERPGVYVTFGTEMAGLAPWAAILEASADLDIDVVATLGSQLDPAALGPAPANVRLERYVPQTALIERAALVCSHAGAGTVIGAASAATPHLSIPIGADQWDNADLITRLGAGPTLELDQRDPGSIAKAVTSVLTDPGSAAAARDLAGLFAAMPLPTPISSCSSAESWAAVPRR